MSDTATLDSVVNEQIETPAEELVETEVDETEARSEETADKTEAKETDEKGEKKDEDKSEKDTKGKPEVSPVAEQVKASLKTISEMKAEFGSKLSTQGKAQLDSLEKTFLSLQSAAQSAKSTTAELKTLEAEHKELADSSAELQSNVEESDRMLYGAGSDPEQAKTLAQNIVDDVLSTNGDITSVSALTSALIDQLKNHGEGKERGADYYQQIVRPAYAEALNTTGMTKAVTQDLVNDYNSALKTGNTDSLRATIESIVKHVQDISKGAPKGEEKPAAKTEQKLAAVSPAAKAAMTEVETQAEKDITSNLGAALRPYFTNYPSLKELSRDEQVAFVSECRRQLMAANVADKDYIQRMAGMWKTPITNKAGLIRTHAEQVKKVAAGIVLKVVQTRFPDLKITATPIVGKPAARTTTTSTAKYVTTSLGKTLVVAVKPKDLDRTAKNAAVHEGSGYGVTKGGVKVCWRPQAIHREKTAS
jgi:hypothetical protein